MSCAGKQHPWFCCKRRQPHQCLPLPPPLQGVTTTLLPCKDLAPVGGAVGTCFNAVSVGKCQTASLRAGGSLAVVQATTCPAGEWVLPAAVGVCC